MLLWSGVFWFESPSSPDESLLRVLVVKDALNVFIEEPHLPVYCFLVMYLMNLVFLVLVVIYNLESSSASVSIHFIGELGLITIDIPIGFKLCWLAYLFTFCGLTLEKFCTYVNSSGSMDAIDPFFPKIHSFLSGDITKLFLSSVSKVLNGISKFV